MTPRIKSTCLLVLSIMGWACLKSRAPNVKNSEATAQAAPETGGVDASKAIDVFIQIAKKESVADTMIFGGFIQPQSQHQIVAELDGTITKNWVRAGATVKNGQKLLELRQEGLGLNYRSLEVRSSVDGQVLTLPLQVGQHVKKGDLLLEVASLDKLSVTIHVSSNDLTDLSVGQEAQLAVGAKDSPKLVAKIQAIAPAVELNSGTYPVRLEFNVPDGLLQYFRPGEFAEVVFKKNERQSFVVPLVALNRKRNRLFWVDNQGHIQKTEVKVGRHLGEHLEIVSGIKLGMKLVVKFAKDPEPGQLANILKQKNRNPASASGSIQKAKPAG